MKKLVFFAVAGSFSVLAVANGQDALESAPKLLPSVPRASFRLTPLGDQAGTYRLELSHAKVGDVLQALAEKTGAKLFLTTGFCLINQPLMLSAAQLLASNLARRNSSSNDGPGSSISPLAESAKIGFFCRAIIDLCFRLP